MRFFTNKKLITSNTDLQNYLKKISKCYKLTNNGYNIISYESLDKFPQYRIKHKMIIIINSLNHNDLEKTTGHWTVLIKEGSNILFLDPMHSSYNKNLPLLSSITNFCKKNNLKLFIFNLRVQTTHSSSCGFIVLYFTYFFANNSLLAFHKLKNMLLNYSIFNREKIILTKIYKIIS